MCRQGEDVFVIPPVDPEPTQKRKLEQFLLENMC